MWHYINPNPYNNFVGDCTVRAISIILNQDWDETYLYLTMKGYEMGDMIGYWVKMLQNHSP